MHTATKSVEIEVVVSDRGVVRSCDPLKYFEGSNHIIGTAEPSNVMTYHH